MRIMISLTCPLFTDISEVAGAQIAVGCVSQIDLTFIFAALLNRKQKVFNDANGRTPKPPRNQRNPSLSEEADRKPPPPKARAAFRSGRPGDCGRAERAAVGYKYYNVFKYG
jgi:hypothetical protein